MGVDPTRARRHFLKHYGFTFHEYCRSRRLGSRSPAFLIRSLGGVGLLRRAGSSGLFIPIHPPQDVEHLGGIGLQIARRDPLWPPGVTEEGLMPLQHAGLAAIYGADFHKDPGQFDPDVAKQIERGLSWRGVEVAAALGASSAISAAFAAFQHRGQMKRRLADIDDRCE